LEREGLDSAGRPASNELAQGCGDPCAEQRHLLVVDDDDRLRDLLREFLTGRGFRVSTSADAAAARRLLAAISFDLLVLDVMMPGEDGLSLTRWLRGRPGQAGAAPVLILTARGDPDDRISDQVRMKLATDPDVKGGALDVTVKGGVVVIKGRVDSDKGKAKATHLAKKVKGVKDVDNELQVGPPTA